MIECERRFLVGDVPDDVLASGEVTRVVQSYLVTEPAAVRVRVAGDRYTLTIKTGTGRSRYEFEREITADDFEAIRAAGSELHIDKQRVRIPLGSGLVAELDLFGGELAGHRIVEVEFPDDESADGFVPPAWFGREITDDERYNNTSLARHGWPE